MRCLLLSAVVLAACSGPDVVDTLRDCELLTDGYLRDLPLYAPTSCYRDCLGEASCEELEQALCRSDVSLLVECDRRCAHECADGSLIAVDDVCDGFENCEGGDDERGCGTYVCDDGTELTGTGHRCDGRWQCPDSSDELDCPVDCDRNPDATCPQHVCDDGERVRRGARCNGWPQCEDGSDEVGCAQLDVMCE